MGGTVKQIMDLIQLKTNPEQKEERCLSSSLPAPGNQLTAEVHDQGQALA